MFAHTMLIFNSPGRRADRIVNVFPFGGPTSLNIENTCVQTMLVIESLLHLVDS